MKSFIAALYGMPALFGLAIRSVCAIGKGAFAEVFLVELENDARFAVKRANTDIASMDALQHEKKLYALHSEEDALVKAYGEDHKLNELIPSHLRSRCMFMEWMPLNLQQLCSSTTPLAYQMRLKVLERACKALGRPVPELKHNQGLPTAVLLHVFAALFQQLDVLHNRGLILADITPQNIMLTADGKPKLGDLGLSIQLPRDSGGTGAILPPVTVQQCSGSYKLLPDPVASAGINVANAGTDKHMMAASLVAVLCEQPFGYIEDELVLAAQRVSGLITFVDAVQQVLCLRELPAELLQIFDSCWQTDLSDRGPDAAAVAIGLIACCRDDAAWIPS